MKGSEVIWDTCDIICDIWMYEVKGRKILPT